MQVLGINGWEYSIKPVRENHVFVIAATDDAPMRGGIYLPGQSRSEPTTVARIAELPDNCGYIKRWIADGLSLGDDVLFHRYATESILTFVHWYDVETIDWQLTYTGVSKEDATRKESIFNINEVHVLDVADIECVIEDGKMLHFYDAPVAPNLDLRYGRK